MDAPFPTHDARTTAQRLGDAGEDQALAFLRARDLRLVARNVRFKGGEIDLVMRDGATLVFVEVRCRSRQDFGSALDSIDARKARRVVLAARLYLQRHPADAQRDCRFDVIALDGRDAAPIWVRDAFRLDDL